MTLLAGVAVFVVAADLASGSASFAVDSGFNPIFKRHVDLNPPEIH